MCRSFTFRGVTCYWFLNLFRFFIIILKLFSSRVLPDFRCLNVITDFNFSSTVKLSLPYPSPNLSSLLSVYVSAILFGFEMCVPFASSVSNFLLSFMTSDTRKQISIREKPFISKAVLCQGSPGLLSILVIHWKDSQASAKWLNYIYRLSLRQLPEYNKQREETWGWHPRETNSKLLWSLCSGVAWKDTSSSWK